MWVQKTIKTGMNACGLWKSATSLMMKDIYLKKEPEREWDADMSFMLVTEQIDRENIKPESALTEEEEKRREEVVIRMEEIYGKLK